MELRQKLQSKNLIEWDTPSAPYWFEIPKNVKKRQRIIYFESKFSVTSFDTEPIGTLFRLWYFTQRNFQYIHAKAQDSGLWIYAYINCGVC